jgi:malate dehydrogenase (oxaloacetate-decarboxylating)(NADP+)
MRHARELIEKMAPELEVEGEMHGDAALSQAIRDKVFPDARFQGPANLLIMPNRDAANIAFNLLKAIEDAISIGPILVGAERPAHILTPSVTTRGIINMAAVSVVNAQERDSRKGAVSLVEAEAEAVLDADR